MKNSKVKKSVSREVLSEAITLFEDESWEKEWERRCGLDYDLIHTESYKEEYSFLFMSNWQPKHYWEEDYSSFREITEVIEEKRDLVNFDYYDWCNEWMYE
jgi:hypothetical protein